MKTILFIFLFFNFLVTIVNSQTIDQKLALVTNDRIVNGRFIINCQLKGSNLGSAKTLASLNMDIIYDTTILRFSSGSGWLADLSSNNGYSKSIKSNASESGKYKSVRIAVTAPNVNDSGYTNTGYDIADQYANIVTVNFEIISISEFALLNIKNITNEIGVFSNPHNEPNTFDISTYSLSEPIVINEPLPIELISFNSIVNINDVKLNWKTSSEINNQGFEIQRAEVGSRKSEFKKISFVSGNGNKSTPTDYSFEDKKLNTGKYNYRLKQIDYNGNFEYFELKSEVVIGVPGKFNISQNYPNPFNPVTKIDFEVPVDSKVNIKIYDITGKEMQTLINENKQAGYHNVVLNANNLASGSYFYRITCEAGQEKFVETKKMMLVK